MMYLFQHNWCDSTAVLLGNGSLVAPPGELTCSIRSNNLWWITCNIFGWVAGSFESRPAVDYRMSLSPLHSRPVPRVSHLTTATQSEPEEITSDTPLVPTTILVPRATARAFTCLGSGFGVGSCSTQ
jgi:hypothetical protein